MKPLNPWFVTMTTIDGEASVRHDGPLSLEEAMDRFEHIRADDRVVETKVVRMFATTHGKVEKTEVARHRVPHPRD
tara:strand:- start:316 stop:543 length:228 start_codon:yes stop_codon:yes gene_type:complete